MTIYYVNKYGDAYNGDEYEEFKPKIKKPKVKPKIKSEPAKKPMEIWEYNKADKRMMAERRRAIKREEMKGVLKTICVLVGIILIVVILVLFMANDWALVELHLFIISIVYGGVVARDYADEEGVGLWKSLITWIVGFMVGLHIYAGICWLIWLIFI